SIRLSDVQRRSVSRLRTNRRLRLVKMYDDGLQQLGLDNAISTGPYDPCGLWSDALWGHRDRPDGVAYRSRHDSGHVCLAIFERADIALSAAPSEPLTTHAITLQQVLTRYGKSIIDDTARG